MNGVVLWSDASQHKAVIWCEDQGDLAFYSQKQPQTPVDLYEGDLVCFELTLQHNTRLAVNPQILEESACRGLAQSLVLEQSKAAEERVCPAEGAKIISFAGRAKEKQREVASRRLRLG